MSTIYSNLITDIKRSGFDGKCNKCLHIQRSLIRITFNRRVGGVDKYLCDPCAKKVIPGRFFNLFTQEIAQRSC